MQAIAAEAFPRLSFGVVWLGLVHSLWVGLALASFVAFWFQARPRLSHGARHAALVAALGAIAVGPILLALLPPISTWWTSSSPTAGVLMTVEVAPGSTEPDSPESNPRAGRLSHRATVSSPRPFRGLGVVHAQMVSVVGRLRPVGLTLWSISVLACTVMFGVGLRRLSRICREADVAPPNVERRGRRLARLLRLRTMPEIRVHDGLDEPCLSGLLRPTVLLPSRWLATAGPESIDAVLAHELAHARRFDHLVNLAQRSVEAALFFHPAVHWLSRSLRRQSELCADALAVRLTGNPLALARALESVARLRLASPAPSLASVTLGGESRFLLTRIQELIGMTPTLPHPQRWPLVALALAVVIAFVAASAGVAQDGPSPQPTVTSQSPATQSQTDARRAVAPDKPLRSALVDTEWDREMSYEVRFIDDESGSCRDQFVSRGRAVTLRADVSGWVIDRPMIRPLLTSLLAGRANLVQAPKVHCLEEVPAHVSLAPPTSGTIAMEYPESDSAYDALIRPKNDKKPRFPMGTQDGVTEGTHIRVRGSESNRVFRIGVEVVEAWRDSVPGLGVNDSGPDRLDRTRLESKIRQLDSINVPEGSSLAINLGRRARRVQGESGVRSAVCDRFVLVTPELRLYEPDPARITLKTKAPAKPRVR